MLGQKTEGWAKINKEFNSCFPLRKTEALQSKFDNLKTAARKYAGTRRQNCIGTGGGPGTTVETNAVFDIIINIMLKFKYSYFINFKMFINKIIFYIDTLLSQQSFT
ncbi:hypothetical protein ABEB36_014961 [Hypothenemus hampei]|uniref:Regulatory protein zeste n=1 Tax=Hypothenemus hampei TaxID=57062 RepID=A0ABD1E1N0_HYPHA